MTLEFNMDLSMKKNMYVNIFCTTLKQHGINFATGVPCGVQKHIIYNLSHDPDICHIPTTRESEAIGIAAGAYLAGKKPIVYMQNSGLFNCFNDIASLLIPYKIPVLLSVSWRGCPGEDTPQHLVTGGATISSIDLMGIPYKVLEKENIEETISSCIRAMEKRQIPTAVLIKRGWYK